MGMKVLFIYGPRGCGKTTNSERFLNHYKSFGYDKVYEEAHYFDNNTKQLSHCIILCNEKPSDEVLGAFGGEAKSFEEAIKESEPS